MLCNLLWSYRNEGFKIFAQSRFLLRHGEHTWMQILSYYFISTLLFFDLPCLDSTNYRFMLRHSLFYWLIQVTIHPSFHPFTYSLKIHFLSFSGIGVSLQKSTDGSTVLMDVFSKGKNLPPRWLSGKESACDTGAAGDKSLIPGSGRSPGGGLATHSSILAIPWTEELGELQSIGSKRGDHD